ncbi:NAD(P)-binding protein [Aspergillus uvarum CBS 121591]|uniref:D-xylose 1-dehydrogenase (NADP(+), D-xylono-1,5-lactone-forming) n=1 Tax=Aspergillus uvarum CBS 121591 TaxID=1448315 RepID=A0A319CLH9_9EURO|nr:NAD(P)-binding protein [Aspergillus uvarum CBS 121591]PYH84781.1 NAD(P)-binding protein [Aspergillus uvarum CBS 121591]
MPDSMTEVPTLRWGILGTGWISTMFVTDVIAPRINAPVRHVVAALGSSSEEKGAMFVQKVWAYSSAPRPRIYDRYQNVYNDENVDIVYVGTPHAVHKQNCLDAITAGKSVLCEKPFAINEHEARDVIHAARDKGVFIMEAVWTRFFPLMRSLHEHLNVKKSIGQVHRLFVDFGLDIPLAGLPASSRLKDPGQGAGALLDIGIYSLTYASLVMGKGKLGKSHPHPQVISMLDIVDGIDESNVVILRYEEQRSTAICTSTLGFKSPEDFARIEGSEGTITIFGGAASCPSGFRLCRTNADPKQSATQTFSFNHPAGTTGFFYEADAVAVDIANGRLENETMPLDETLRMLRLMDTIRKDGGLVYFQDQDR